MIIRLQITLKFFFFKYLQHTAKQSLVLMGPFIKNTS